MFKNIRTLFNHHRDLFHLVVMLWVFQILDVLTTMTFISMGATEGNPVMSLVISMGWGYVWGAKFLVMCIAPLVAVQKRKAIISLTYIYAGVIVWNMMNIRLLATL